MKRVLVVAPHPDDETLGCGGTLLRHRELGDEIHWAIVTQMDTAAPRFLARKGEIKAVGQAYGFASVQELGFQTTRLDTVPMGDLVDRMGQAIKEVQPATLYVPFSSDVHSDHRAVFSAVAACTKWFRYASITRVLAYETLSETDLSIDPAQATFRPTTFVDISKHLARKIEIMGHYSGEMGEFPFPRSAEAIRALSAVRGAASGFAAAEAFQHLKERW